MRHFPIIPLNLEVKSSVTVTIPGASQFKSNVFGSAIDTTLGDASLWATESSLYAEDDMRFGSLGLNLGVHTSGFYVQQKFFSSLQPRIAARYLLRNDFTVKASFATMTQYINLLTNEGAGLPSDLWVPSTKIFNLKTPGNQL